LFLVKYAPDGAVLWARNASVISWNVTHQGSMSPVAVDAAGNIYVSGAFRDYAIFGSDTLYPHGTPGNDYDIFLAKYDPNGNMIWVKSYGGESWDYAMAISTDANNNLYITGFYSSDTLTFDSFHITNSYDTLGSTDIFLAKFDANGNALWAKSIGGTDFEQAWSIAVDNSGNSFISGFFDSPKFIIGNDTLNHSGYQDNLFIAKFDTNGNTLWANTATNVGGTVNDDGAVAYAVATDASGNAYLTGSFFCPTLIIGAYSLSLSSPPGDGEIFLAKYDANGNVQWAKCAGGVNDDRSASVAVSASGNAYITGYFDSPSITFAPYTLTNVSTDHDDMYLVKYDNSGIVLWAKNAIGTFNGGGSNGTSVAVTKNSEEIYVAGYFSDTTLVFDTITLMPSVPYNTNLFLAKISGSCSAYFYLYPDTTTPHNYYALNMASGVSPISYYWNWGDGTYDTIAYPNHTYSSAGFYTICLNITDSAGCTNMYCDSFYLQKNTNSIISVNVISTTAVGIISNYNDNLLSIFPNPAKDNLTLILSKNSFDEECRIFNILGEEKYFSKIKNPKTNTDISNFANGIYIIEVKSGDNIIRKKFIKE